MSVKVTSRGLKAGKKEIPLILGAVHYWRLEKKLWPRLLDKVKEMGFGMIETYIPWSVHETGRGEFDFGKVDPDKDVDRFLSLCEDKDIYVMVRPGPHINSEITYFGYPERVLADRECLASSAQDTPVVIPVPPRAFPVPGYANEKFYEEVAVWFDAVCPIIKKHIHPGGNVVAIQADNECSFFFRTNAYDLDYSDGSKKLFARYLEEKYGDLDLLNETYGTNYSKFGQVEMPRRFNARKKEDLPRYIDWAAYKEYYLVNALARIRGMFVERGIKDIPVTHNFPAPDLRCPFNIPAVEREIDIQGFDMYPTRKDYANLKKGCLTAAAQSRLPFIPEFGSGGWLWFTPLTFEDQKFATLAAFMHGIKAINYYMLVERERWYGSPVARDGRTRQPNFDFYKKLNEIMESTGLTQLEHRADVLLVYPRSYQRLENASTVVEPAPTLVLRLFGVKPESDSSEEKFGFEEPVQIAAERLFRAWYAELEIVKFPFVVGDTDMDLDAMCEYPLMVAPTYEFMASDEQDRLLEYARKGGVLVIGPRVPELDDGMKPCDTLKKAIKGRGQKLEGYPDAMVHKAGKGKIVLTDGLNEEEVYRTTSVEAAAALAGIHRPFLMSDPKIEMSLHSSKDGKTSVLFVANPTEASRTASIIFDEKLKFTDLWTGEKLQGSGCVEFEVPPQTVSMLEVQK